MSPVGQHIECRIEGSLSRLLEEAVGSMIISTFQANKVVAAGSLEGRMTALMREFDRPTGLASSPGSLALILRKKVILLANAETLAESFCGVAGDRYDSLWIPRVSYHTGDLDLHELAFDGAGELWAVNTRFSCLCGVSAKYNFEPRWQPSFISLLAPEDRCHLNGLAMAEGRPAYVTCFAESDSPEGWRGRKSAGCVIDVQRNEVVLRGLSMPHSPRWYQGKLWVLNSAVGELLRVDPIDGSSEIVAVLPGYLRGLDFVGRYALVGMSMGRQGQVSGELPVRDRFPELRCGVAWVDLMTGEVAGSFLFTSACTEIFDVKLMPGYRKPMLLNREREECGQAFTAPGFGYWIREVK